MKSLRQSHTVLSERNVKLHADNEVMDFGSSRRGYEDSIAMPQLPVGGGTTHITYHSDVPLLSPTGFSCQRIIFSSWNVVCQPKSDLDKMMTTVVKLELDPCEIRSVLAIF